MTPKERIFQTIKDEMIKNIESAKLDTITQTDELNQELFGYAYYLAEVPNHLELHENDDNNPEQTENDIDTILDDHEPDQELEEIPSIESTESTNESEDSVPEINDIPETSVSDPTESDKNQDSSSDLKGHTEDPMNIGILKRGLANGRIVTQDERNIFIPESIIRKHEYTHGDIIKFEPMVDRPDTNHHFYTLVQKSKRINTEREEFTNGIVIYDYESDEYYVNQNILGQSLKELQNDVQKYVLTEQEVRDYNIQDNSIVDIAWYRDSVADTIRVIWRH